MVDQDAVPGQSQVEEVEPRVEEVQETMDIHQQPLVVSQPEDMTAGSSSQKAAPVVSGTARFLSDTPRFLAKFELLLSETELEAVSHTQPLMHISMFKKQDSQNIVKCYSLFSIYLKQVCCNGVDLTWQ